MDLCNLRDIQALLRRYGFHFSKSMGQNFLIERWVPQKIAELSGVDASTGVLEIGPGIGTLTVELAPRAGCVTAIELDRSLIPVLDETLAAYPNVHVRQGDVMKLDLSALLQEFPPSLTPVVCANLPYQITTPVLTLLLGSKRFQTITVMIQKEVAERICAAPRNRTYGAFSIFCQYHAKTEWLFDVPNTCFFPAPKVTSSVVRLTPQNPPACVHQETFFFRTVRGAFGQRRKTLLNALAAAFPFPKEKIHACIQKAGLSDIVRAEQLSIPEFARLADELLLVASAQ